ncbi:receptor-type tyrosine-protein phosphatase mu-like [Crassostrea virginica]
MQNTISDFWQMVWQEQIHVIALVNNHLDVCKVLQNVSMHYWPDSNDCVKETDKFMITLLSTKVYASFAIRHINVYNKEISESYDITHLEFNSWLGNVMPNPFDLVIYHNYVTRAMEKYPDSKLLVHCSSGIGPTAVIIALDALYKHGLVTGVINVQEFTRKMRNDRIGMIQNLDQYICLYKCLNECFRAKMCVVTKDELQNEPILLRANNEFCILLSMISGFRNDEHSLPCKQDLECEYEIPKGMNREDMLIQNQLGQHCGILLSSFTTKDCIIAGSYPSHGEAADLIRHLIDQKCSTLVSVNPLCDVPYSKEWYCIDPSDDLTKFQVEVIKGPKVSQHVSLSTLRMRIHSTQNWHQVTVYQITSWGLMEKLPPDTCALLDVIKIIQLDKSCGSNTDFVVLSRYNHLIFYVEENKRYQPNKL